MAVRWPALLALLALPAGLSAAEPKPPSPEQLTFFEAKVRPVLAEACFSCHADKKQKGELRLDSMAAILAGGESGPALVPGKPAESILVKAIGHGDEHLKMPKKKLSQGQIDDVTRWVAMGAPWPADDRSTTSAPVAPKNHVSAQDRQHWAFKPVARPAVPSGPAGLSAIDKFVAQKLESKGLAMSPPASKRDLLRRAYYDLIGLPPTLAEVERFEADSSPDAFEKVIDTLLARPQYGERWGRHWLDLVRYGQTNGYERDGEKAEAWRYRDYVIKSFNADKPYDQFVREQVAGDEIAPDSDDAIIATGFYRLGVWDDEPDDMRQAEFDDLDDMISTASDAFLGVSLGCARCHDHKFDPFPQEDYYGMLAFLRGVKTSQKDALRALKNGSKAQAAVERDKIPATHVLIRGAAATPGKAVDPKFLRVLFADDASAAPKLPAPAKDAKSSGRRTVLADWLASPKNPLTARVMVNRVWQHHFGRAIVETPNDFGKNGAPPSHPELLDYLASEFVEQGWSLKKLHKQVMLSKAWQQASKSDNPKADLADPANNLVWRQNLRRLEAEAIRDTILSVNGKLNPAMGGRGVFPDLPPEVLQSQSQPGKGWGKSSPEEQNRRSVYLFVKRSVLVPMMEGFDQPNPDKSAPVRAVTTIAPQSLILLNSDFMDKQASALARRVESQAGQDSTAQINEVYKLVLARQATSPERESGVSYLDRARQKGVAPSQALERFCKAALNLNEMVYVD